MNYIGVDLGTSSVKLLLMDKGGQILNTVSCEYPIEFPKSGWSEQNPYDWYDATIKGIKKLLKGFDKKSVAGLSFGGQMHGLVILDDKDDVIRPAILWNDGRTIKECNYLNNTIGRDKLSLYTANIAFAGFTAPKILWLRNNEEDNFNRIKKIMLPKDYLAYRLTGEFSTDVSDASGTLLFDVSKRDWSDEMLKICGITRDVMPHIYESYEEIGHIKKEVASQLGLGEDVIVAAGAGDNAAAAIGTGTIGDGNCNISLGTSGTVFISSKNFRVDENNALHSFAHADGAYHLMGCMLSAASCNGWWMDKILKTKEYSKEQENISADMLGNNHVYFLPYLMGERSPHNDPKARGVFVGMSMDSTRDDLTLAVLEGVAYGLKDSIEVAKRLGINITETKICGGGAKSDLWCNILSNVLGINVLKLAIEEGPSMGACILAMVANGEYSSVKEAVDKIVTVSSVIKPDEKITKRYEARYKEFRGLYPALKGSFATMID